MPTNRLLSFGHMCWFLPLCCNLRLILLFFLYMDFELSFMEVIIDLSLCIFLQRLFVAQTDNMETSSCIISPQQVKYGSFSSLPSSLAGAFPFFILLIFFFFCSFLLNGKGVDKRITCSMVCVALSSRLHVYDSIWIVA